MGGMLSQPVTDKRSNQGDGLGLKYGLSSMQGWRSEMEDAHDVQIGLKYGLDDWSYFAVFDGHAGKRAAAFAAWNLLEFILRDKQFKLDTDNLPEHVCIEPDLEKLHEIIRVENSSSSSSCQLSAEEKQSNGDEKTKSSDVNNQDCAKTNEKSATEEGTALSSTTQQNTSSSTTTTTATITTTTTTTTTSFTENSNTPTTNNEAKQDKQTSATVQGDGQTVSEFVTLSANEQSELVKKAIKSGFLRIDQSLRDSGSDMSGSTAICSLISPTRLFIANCGDSRAILCGMREATGPGAHVIFATEDHKPLNPKERARIIAAGGCATQRINGTLAVSRALGDFEFKKVMSFGPCEQMVSPEPEVTVIKRDPRDAFLVLACDGIWDVMENYELCFFIDYKLKLEPKLEDVCSSVLDVCLHKGSRDNMSIIIVVFENGPKFSEEELEKDRKNDELLKVLIRKFNHGEKHDNFNEFMYGMKQRFSEMEAEWKSEAYLPPGAGLIAKHEMIREMFEKEFEEKSDPKTDDEYV